MLTTAVFELVKQFVLQKLVGLMQPLLSALALISLSRQNKYNFSDKVNYRQTQS